MFIIDRRHHSILRFACLLAAVLAGKAAPVFAQASPDSPSFDRSFASDIQPLLDRYCFECHAAPEPEGDLDLATFTSLEAIRRQLPAWQKVDEMLHTGQMPPKKSNQPTDAEIERLRQWVRSFLTAEARAHAGDPGRVVLRRLSNAEYTYTVRDLTGVASLDPAEEFPVDGAAGEGFTNTGDALVMSPSLLTKFLDAAKGIAAHAVLLPEGIAFSEKTTRRDWTDEWLTRIRNFYSRFTDHGGGTAVNLQGIQFDTNQGGLLPLPSYLAALLAHRDALRQGATTLAAIAGERSLSLKYLQALWRELEVNPDEPPSLPMDAIRAQWRNARNDDDASALAERIERWQESLWKFNSVGHIGRPGGAKRWMEPVTPLVARQEFKLKLPETPDGQDAVVHLVADDAGDGRNGDFVVWSEPRLEGGGLPPLPLRYAAGLQETLSEHRQTNHAAPEDFTVLLSGVKTDERFVRHPMGHKVDANDLVVQAPATATFRIPSELAKDRELVVSGRLDAEHGRAGSVQLTVTTSDDALSAPSPGVPILVADDSPARARLEASLDSFRQLFPLALCYTKIVPVDEVVTLNLFYREDEVLRRLMLDDAQSAQLDRLWDELLFVSQEPLEMVTALEQLIQFATQDRPDLVTEFEPLREPVARRADAFRQRQTDAERVQVHALLDWADRAWRRPLSEAERDALRDLYRELRDEGLAHDRACRLMLARILTSPAFLYRLEQPAPGDQAAPVTSLELASRLSYFLWSSLPDGELRRVAEDGRLTEERVMVEQTRRMLRDERTRRLAVEFACQWLHIRGFDETEEKNERLYPGFAALRGPMYEESVRFFEDMFRNDGSILDILDADHTFLNGTLAGHYGIGGVAGEEWRRVDGVREKQRGGVLAMATVLASQSGASRTSPILRGNWIYETLLGEQLPKPPPNVPQLPESLPSGLTARQLIERHSSDPACAKCHVRIDPYGFALEQYDVVGRVRPAPVDTKTTVFTGQSIEGIDGLRNYLLNERRGDVVRQFCGKLLGFALGRAVQLSDQLLLEEMQRKLAERGYRFSVAVEAVVTSPQFRNIRGMNRAHEE